MKQIVQDIKNGHTSLQEVPVPNLKSGHILVKSTRSLVSLGTERMLIDFGKANIINKARQQPEKVNQVFNKLRTDGIRPTYTSVMNKLSQPLPLGYSNVGIVVGVTCAKMLAWWWQSHAFWEHGAWCDGWLR